MNKTLGVLDGFGLNAHFSKMERKKKYDIEKKAFCRPQQTGYGLWSMHYSLKKGAQEKLLSKSRGGENYERQLLGQGDRLTARPY